VVRALTAYHRPMRSGARAGAAAAAVSAVLTLGACGSDSSTTATDTAVAPSTPTQSPATQPSTPTSPTCDAVWRDGRQLDTAYAGCATEKGWVKAQVYECSDGHRVVTFAHAFYAQPGRKITRSDTILAKDPAFRHLMAACGA